MSGGQLVKLWDLLGTRQLPGRKDLNTDQSWNAKAPNAKLVYPNPSCQRPRVTSISPGPELCLNYPFAVPFYQSEVGHVICQNPERGIADTDVATKADNKPGGMGIFPSPSENGARIAAVLNEYILRRMSGRGCAALQKTNRTCYSKV